MFRMMIESNIFIYLFVVIPVLSDRITREPSWYYPENENWPETCKGKRQSPIDIKDADTELETYPKFELGNYDKFITTDIANDGHTVMITVNSKHNLYITGGGIDGRYDLEQIHFHWQSEHTLDGKRLPLEVHFVHRATILKNNTNELHVLSGLFHVIKNNNTELNQFFYYLPLVKKLGNDYTINVNLRQFLPKNVQEFYRYEGSLTIPVCSENVQWTVFNSKIPISDEQYKIFQSMETFNGTFSDTFRNTQPLNNRKLSLVYSSGNISRSSELCLAIVLLIVTTSKFL